MNCRFCGALNAREDQRCIRCGRRLHLAKAQPAPETYPLRDSTVPLFTPENNPVPENLPLQALSQAVGSAVPVVAPEPEAAPVPRARTVAYQPSLFQEIGNVIPFRPPEAPKTARRAKRSSGSTVKTNKPKAETLSFDFALPEVPGEIAWMGERGMGPSALAGQPSPGEPLRVPDSEIYCDAPVAPMPARVLAASMDLALVTMAFAVFASIYFLVVENQMGDGAAQLAWKARLLGPYALIFAAVGVLYKSLYAFANTDSPGVRWANLKIVNFDGETPVRAERVSRMAWSWLSVAAVGIGLLWSLVDEEHLTWHDLLSKTFPSERS